jgi:Na+/H+ antiporter NhaD/arsenite permease-like protein
MRKVITFFGLLIATMLILWLSNWFDMTQGKSIAVFSMFILGTLIFGEFRLAFALGGIAALMAGNLITIEQFVNSANLDVIVFLIGTFLVIGFLEENQFFEGIVATLVNRIGPRPQWLLLAMMIMASISSSLVDEVTAILFMSGTLLHMTSKFKLNPVPFIIMLVFSCNIGSSMSSVGNPIGVLIALKTGLTFADFVKWAAPVAILVDITVFFICRWWFAAAFKQFEDAVREHLASGEKDAPDENIQHDRSNLVCWLVLISLLVLLVTHSLTERLLGLRHGTMMVAAALTMGSVVLFIRREHARDLVERRIDWWTLSFFMMLFASVGTLEHTGVTNVIAHKVQSNFNSPTAMIQVIGWSTGWLSAFLDNVLAVATFMPVVQDIRVNAAPQHYSSAIYWMMLFGGTYMGNMTVIGSTANIIALGLLEKRGHGGVSFWQWFKIGFIVAVASMIVATLALFALDHSFGIPYLPPPAMGADAGH